VKIASHRNSFLPLPSTASVRHAESRDKFQDPSRQVIREDNEVIPSAMSNRSYSVNRPSPWLVHRRDGNGDETAPVEP
jgi:hypothetical protein